MQSFADVPEDHLPISIEKGYIFHTVKFESDPEKSRANSAKHGISFGQAEQLWQDNLRLVIPARSEDEARFAIVASWGDRLWTGIFTLRGDSVRLISVRRARTNEEALYESTGI